MITTNDNVPGTTTYIIRDGFDWAEVHIRPFQEGVSVMADSSWGKFSYRWHSIGKGCPYAWLYNTDYGYFFGKVASNGGEVWDFDASAEKVKRDAIERRREGLLEKEETREVWDALKHIEPWCDNEQSYVHAVLGTTIPDIVYDGDLASMSTGRIKDPRCIGFWGMWRGLLEHVLASQDEEDRQIHNTRHGVE